MTKIDLILIVLQPKVFITAQESQEYLSTEKRTMKCLLAAA